MQVSAETRPRHTPSKATALRDRGRFLQPAPGQALPTRSPASVLRSQTPVTSAYCKRSSSWAQVDIRPLRPASRCSFPLQMRGTEAQGSGKRWAGVNGARTLIKDGLTQSQHHWMGEWRDGGVAGWGARCSASSPSPQGTDLRRMEVQVSGPKVLSYVGASVSPPQLRIISSPQSHYDHHGNQTVFVPTGWQNLTQVGNRGGVGGKHQVQILEGGGSAAQTQHPSPAKGGAQSPGPLAGHRTSDIAVPAVAPSPESSHAQPRSPGQPGQDGGGLGLTHCHSASSTRPSSLSPVPADRGQAGGPELGSTGLDRSHVHPHCISARVVSRLSGGSWDPTALGPAAHALRRPLGARFTSPGSPERACAFPQLRGPRTPHATGGRPQVNAPPLSGPPKAMECPVVVSGLGWSGLQPWGRHLPTETPALRRGLLGSCVTFVSGAESPPGPIAHGCGCRLPWQRVRTAAPRPSPLAGVAVVSGLVQGEGGGVFGVPTPAGLLPAEGRCVPAGSRAASCRQDAHAAALPQQQGGGDPGHGSFLAVRADRTLS
ncbi:PREDICTED: collagen alpha-1(I) chain-like [Dipodomys ordii]|uniref:Collagen alpha-1(I) chain-like n=1 Tax=Dipodomys ordii TaxID=10020 RepID=A0A1S3ERZ1_DIPOR|nr:PREDICTED: collagen alpha-1(I) chain-like [Dipodomys ordii]